MKEMPKKNDEENNVYITQKQYDTFGFKARKHLSDNSKVMQ